MSNELITFNHASNIESSCFHSWYKHLKVEQDKQGKKASALNITRRKMDTAGDTKKYSCSYIGFTNFSTQFQVLTYFSARLIDPSFLKTTFTGLLIG